MSIKTLIKYGTLLLSVLIAAALYAIINQLSNEQILPVNGQSHRGDEPVFILDPGHGGEDGGAVSADGLVESGVNLDIALRLRELCGFFGIQSVMTREEEHLNYPANLNRTSERKRWDTRRRTEFINTWENGILLSIHQNNFPTGSARGPQAFYGNKTGSRELAELIHGNMIAWLHPESRRVAAPAPKEVYIMSNSDCPAVLVECGFLSDPTDCALLRTDVHKKKIAAILMASCLQYTEATNEGQNDILLHGVRQ